MSMTMRTYDMDSKTARVVRERGTVTVKRHEDLAPLMSSAYPPCQCPRCSAGPDDVANSVPLALMRKASKGR